MSILITRPLRDARPLGDALRALGHDPLIEPLLAIAPRTGTKIRGNRFQAVLVTSANAVHAAVELGLHREFLGTRVLAVGTASAGAARDAGFADVLSADGDLDALVDLCRRQLHPDSGPLLYLSGAAISGDLKARLNEPGFSVERAVLYDARPAKRLSGDIRQRIAEGQLDAVLFSPRTARIWTGLLESDELTRLAGGIRHVCLSAAVGDVLAGAGIARSVIAVAKTPDQPALMRAVDDDR